jgi:hypothetical protein
MNCFVDGCDKQANFVPKFNVPALDEPKLTLLVGLLNWPACNEHIKELDERVTVFTPGLRERMHAMLTVGSRSMTIHDVEKGEGWIFAEREQHAIPDIDNISITRIAINSDEYIKMMERIENSRPSDYTPPI